MNVLPIAHPRQIGALGAHSEKWFQCHWEWENRKKEISIYEFIIFGENTLTLIAVKSMIHRTISVD